MKKYFDPNNYTFSVPAASASETFDIWVYAQATNNDTCNDINLDGSIDVIDILILVDIILG